MKPQIMLFCIFVTLLAACSGGTAPTLPTETPLPLTPTLVSPTETPLPPTPPPSDTPSPTAKPENTPTPTPEVSRFANLGVVTELKLNELDKLPYVSSEDATSPEFTLWLDQLEAQGKIPTFTQEDRTRLAGFEFGSQHWKIWPRTEEKAEALRLGLPTNITHVGDDDLNMKTYTNFTKRPEIYQAFFQTQIGGKKCLLWVQKWLNDDGTTARIKYVRDFGSVAENWNYLYSQKSADYITAPVSYPDNSTFGAGTWFDRNYYKNYWSLHGKEMQSLIDNFQAGQNLKFTSDFENYLWSPFTAATNLWPQ